MEKGFVMSHVNQAIITTETQCDRSLTRQITNKVHACMHVCVCLYIYIYRVKCNSLPCLDTMTKQWAPWSRVLCEKLEASQLVRFHTFYGTWKFSTVFTRAHHLSLSWVRLFQCMPLHFISLISIMLPSTPRSSKWSCSFRFSYQNSVCSSLPLMYAVYPAHLIILHLITGIILDEESKSCSFSVCSFVQSHVIFALLREIICPR